MPTGVEGFTSQEDQEMLSRIENQLKRRFAIGSQVSEHSIIQDFTKQVGLPRGLGGGRKGAGGVLVAALPPSNQCLVARQTGCGTAVPHLRPVPSSLGTASAWDQGTCPIPYGEGTGSHGTTPRLPPALPTYPFFPLPGVCEVREGQPEG